VLDFFFKWLRDRSRSAVLDGIADAVEEVTAGGHPTPPRLAALAASLTPPPALPESTTDAEPAKGGRRK
jgi:hypothetical protein